MSTRTMTRALVFAILAPGALVGCSDETNIDITDPRPRDRDLNPSAQDWEWRGLVAPGNTIEIKGILGSIQASQAPTSEVEVYATKQGTRSDPSEIRLEVVTHAGGVTICAVYPTPAGRRPNECRPGNAGRMNVRDNDVEVTFTVLVPAGVDFVGKAVAGDIEADNLSSDAFLTSVAGNVRVHTRGLAEATTVSGSVTAFIGSADWHRDIEFTTVSGNISVEIPSATNAHVKLSTASGSIDSDFALEQHGTGRREGLIGNGGPKLTLSAVSGNIALTRGL